MFQRRDVRIPLPKIFGLQRLDSPHPRYYISKTERGIEQKRKVRKWLFGHFRGLESEAFRLYIS